MINVESLLLIVAIIVALFFIGSFARILREYERAVIFRLGRSTKAILNPAGRGTGPGSVLLVPLLAKGGKVRMRTVAMAVPPLAVLPTDIAPQMVTAMITFRAFIP